MAAPIAVEPTWLAQRAIWTLARRRCASVSPAARGPAELATVVSGPSPMTSSMSTPRAERPDDGFRLTGGCVPGSISGESGRWGLDTPPLRTEEIRMDALY